MVGISHKQKQVISNQKGECVSFETKQSVKAIEPPFLEFLNKINGHPRIMCGIFSIAINLENDKR